MPKIYSFGKACALYWLQPALQSECQNAGDIAFEFRTYSFFAKPEKTTCSEFYIQREAFSQNAKLFSLRFLRTLRFKKKSFFTT
mgnify:FL=1|jgi:hypothetical protein